MSAFDSLFALVDVSVAAERTPMKTSGKNRASVMSQKRSANSPSDSIDAANVPKKFKSSLPDKIDGYDVAVVYRLLQCVYMSVQSSKEIEINWTQVSEFLKACNPEKSLTEKECQKLWRKVAYKLSPGSKSAPPKANPPYIEKEPAVEPYVATMTVSQKQWVRAKYEREKKKSGEITGEFAWSKISQEELEELEASDIDVPDVSIASEIMMVLQESSLPKILMPQKEAKIVVQTESAVQQSEGVKMGQETDISMDSASFMVQSTQYEEENVQREHEHDDFQTEESEEERWGEEKQEGEMN